MTDPASRSKRRLALFVLVLLIVEFLDEFAYSAREAAWPLIRDTFDLSYGQIGLLISVPSMIAILIEPILGIFADTGKRLTLIVVGGVIFGIGLIIQGFASSYAVFMISMIVQFPSVGVFIGIAQASLMDYEPSRRENNMALWTFSGSLAVVAGPLVLMGLIALGGSWRTFFVIAGIISIVAALWITRLPANRALRSTDDSPDLSIRESIQGAIALMKRGAVWRWMMLLQFSDLMLDVLFSLLALYMVDVTGVSLGQAGIAVAVWTGVGLLGDFLLIPILERIRGLVYLRFSVVMELVLYPLFLLADDWWLKLILLGLIGLFNAGWHAILQGKLYDELGEQSGAIMIVSNIAGIFGALLPTVLGLVAQSYGLDAAMWLLLAGPIALMLGLPRSNQAENSDESTGNMENTTLDSSGGFED